MSCAACAWRCCWTRQMRSRRVTRTRRRSRYEFWRERAAIAAQSSQVATFHVVDGRPPRRQRHRPAPRPRRRGRPGGDVGRPGVAPARHRPAPRGGRVPLGGAPGQRLDRAGRARAEHGRPRPLPRLRLRGDRRAAPGRGGARPDGAADAPLAGHAATGPGGEAPPPTGRAGRPARGAARLRPALATAARDPAPRGGSRPGARPSGAARRRHAGAGRRWTGARCSWQGCWRSTPRPGSSR